jgi:hypothetical protein
MAESSPLNDAARTDSGDSTLAHSRVYNIWRDLDILHEISTAVWITNFKQDDTRFVWANAAALRLWNKPSLMVFISTDIMSERSLAVQKIHQDLYQDVQV